MEKANSYENEIEGRNSLIRKVYRDGYQYATNVIYISEGQEPKEIVRNYEQPEEIYEKTKQAEKDFKEILENVMGEEKLPQRLQRFLQQQKIECAAVLKEYDGIISELKAGLKEKDKDYRMKIEKQRVQRDLLQKRVESFMSELANAGKTEIAALRKTIVDRTKEESDKSWKKINEFFDGRSSDKAYDSQLWVKLSDMITSQQMQDAFLIDQREIFELRKRLFADVCKLRSELERQKAEYNLNKEKLEQGLFDLKKSCARDLPLLAQLKREYVLMTDKKAILLKKLKEIKQEIAVERKNQEKQQVKLTEKISAVKELNRSNQVKTQLKYYKVFLMRQTEAIELLSHILYTDRIIHERILNVPWPIHQMPKLKLKESDSGAFEDSPTTSLTSISDAQVQTEYSKMTTATIQSSDPNNQAEYSKNTTASIESSDVSESSIDNEMDLGTVLQCLSDEMGFILDHHYVEYFKTALEKEKTIVTLGALFKMFKLRPEDDMKPLKQHMIPYCKYVDSHTQSLQIDHRGVVEGFQVYLHSLKHKEPENMNLRKHEPEKSKYSDVLKYQENYWNGFLETMPKVRLWDAVLEALEQYLRCQQTRSQLFEMKSALMVQNSELERCLKNFEQ